MKPEEHARLATLEREYWWHVGRRHIVRAVLRKAVGNHAAHTLVDVGCGSGGNLELLAEFGTVIAMDDAPAALSLVRETGHARVVCGSAIHLPFDAGSLDVIALLDVLEHIEDDKTVLAECHRVLKPGAVLLMTVPAYQWLWSGHDEALGHKRRYRRSKLAALVAGAGFETRTISYAVSVLFPLIAGFRVLERVMSKRQQTSYVMVPPWLNALFASFMRAEAKAITSGVRLPFGTSIILAGVKQENHNRRAGS
jgi:SAM-dependent methyltransferase